MPILTLLSFINHHYRNFSNPLFVLVLEKFPSSTEGINLFFTGSLPMNKFVYAALAGVFAAGVSVSAHADDMKAGADKEKCYGIAKAGKNACKSVDGSHACASMAKADNDPNEWTFVAKGECAKSGGTTEPKKK